MTFNIGDRVYLSKDSEFFGDNNSNPDSEDEIGTITYIFTGGEHIHVTWDAGYQNGYESSDLVLYKGEDMLDTSEMYTRINRDHVQAGDTEIIKATRRRKGHSQYIIRYQGSSQRIATVRKCDIPKLVAALLDMYDGRV